MNNRLSKLNGYYDYYKRNGLSMTIGRIIEHMRLENPVRVSEIKAIQRRRLSRYDASKTKRLIVILTLDRDIVDGGVLINSIYNETCKLKPLIHAEVVMCTVPGGTPLLRYTKFQNHSELFTFLGVLSHFRFCERILVHIPEIYVEHFAAYCSTGRCLQKTDKTTFQFNILLQNIDFMPSKVSIEVLKRLGSVTCTTAHEAYSNHKTQERLGCPVHKLSTYVSPEQYSCRTYSEKESLMVVSPDVSCSEVRGTGHHIEFISRHAIASHSESDVRAIQRDNFQGEMGRHSVRGWMAIL